MQVDPNDPRAPYVQIADELRRAINAGELHAGDRLDSVRKLADRFGVAPMTVQQAIRELRNEGVVVTWQGRGVFVRTADPDGAEDETARVSRRLESMHEAIVELESRVAQLEQDGLQAPQPDR